MPELGYTYILYGKSKKEYRFRSYPISEIPSLTNCIYIFVNYKEHMNNATFGKKLAIGQIGNIPLTSLEIPNKANYVCVLEITSEEERIQIIEDLRNNPLFKCSE